MLRPIPLLAAFLVATGTAHAAPPALPLPKDVLQDGQLRIGAFGGYLKSTRNLDSEGGKSEFRSTGEHSFQSVTTNAFVQYGATSSLTLLGELPFVVNTVDGRAGTRNVTNTASGLGDARLGLRYEANREPVRILLDAGVQFPLYSRLSPEQWSTFNAGSEVPRGEGATELGAFGTAEITLAANTYFGAGAGFTQRTGGFSNLLPYTGYLRYQEPQSFFLRLGLVGQASVSDDQFTRDSAGGNVPADRATNAIVGSHAMNAINPSFLKADVVLGTYLAKTAILGAGAQFPLTGKNIPSEAVFTALLGFELGGRPAEGTGASARSNRGFLQYYLTSKVLVANSELKQVLIDKGRNNGIRIGELLDVFEPDGKDGVFGETVARARVLEAGPTRAKLQILEVFKDATVEEGFVVRRPVR